jgi:hypothetical protein
MKKQDRQGVRTINGLEQKYDLGGMGGGNKQQSEQLRQLIQSFSQHTAAMNKEIASIKQQVSDMTPVVTVEDIEGGHRITLKDTDTEYIVDVMDGVNGHTPEKGVDYFTEDDIAMILAKFGDYIIECGSEDGWEWEKWNSGKLVCRGKFTEKITHYTTVNSFYGYHSAEYTYPVAFIDIPMMHYNCRVGTGFSISAGDVSHKKEYAKCYALSNASGEKDCVWIIEATGKWK